MNYIENAQQIAKKTNSTKIIRFLQNTDLRCMHEGLAKVAKDEGVDVTDLNPGEFVVFANSRMTGIKVYAPGNVIAYLKSPDNHRIEIRAIQYLPRFFNGTEFNYSGALKKFFEVRKMKEAA